MAQQNSIEDDKVYFRFQEDAAAEETRADRAKHVNTFIPKQHLKAKPASLLAQLASRKWNTTENTTEKNPITVSITPIRDEWAASIVGMIQECYQLLFEKKPNAPKLPEHVELANALVVLEYFGLQVENPADVSLEKALVPERLRAKLFLKQMVDVIKAKDLVIKQLDEHPQRETHFLFAKESYTVDLANDKSRPRTSLRRSFFNPDVKVKLNAVRFVGMGETDNELERHSDWAHFPTLRQHFISLLEDEAELDACFLTGRDGVLATLQHPEYEIPRLLKKHKDGGACDGFALVNLDVERDSFFPTVTAMPVLRVRICPPAKKQKI